MITVYAFSRVTKFAHGRTRELRVLWALEEMGLPYRIEGMDHPSGALDTESYRSVSPFQQIPAIDNDGVKLTESGAILLHLANKSGRLVPAGSAERDQVIRWCFAALNTVELPMILLDVAAIAQSSGANAEHQRTEAIELAHLRLSDLERWMDGREFVATESFTVADILMAHVLSEQMADEDLYRPYPQLRAYRARCLARPSWHRVIDAYRNRVMAA